MSFGWILRENEIVWKTHTYHYNTVEAAVESVMRDYHQLRTIMIAPDVGNQRYLVADDEPHIGWGTTNIQLIGKFAPDKAREILLTYARML